MKKKPWIKEVIKNISKKRAMGFDYDKYWTRREKLFDEKTPSIFKNYYKYYLRKINAKNGADINFCSDEKNNFKSRPILEHGIIGIVIAGGVLIGENCYISHQVTIGRSRNKAPVIGDNVYIGPGAKIFGGIKIGNNVRIGANCIVFQDIPDNATVVLEKPRIIIKDALYSYFTYKTDS